jgi:hypothetical protein
MERPCGWWQDRIVRTCALEGFAELEDVQTVLREEVDRYNNYQVHSTTREMPSLRFNKAVAGGNILFRPFSPPKPYASPKDFFLPPSIEKGGCTPPNLALRPPNRHAPRPAP